MIHTISIIFSILTVKNLTNKLSQFVGTNGSAENTPNQGIILEIFLLMPNFFFCILFCLQKKRESRKKHHASSDDESDE